MQFFERFLQTMLTKIIKFTLLSLKTCIYAIFVVPLYAFYIRCKREMKKRKLLNHKKLNNLCLKLQLLAQET